MMLHTAHGRIANAVGRRLEPRRLDPLELRAVVFLILKEEPLGVRPVRIGLEQSSAP